MVATSQPETLGYRMKLASHSVLAAAASNEHYRFPRFAFLSPEEAQEQQIDELNGLSPELMNIIQDCNELAFRPRETRMANAYLILDRLRELRQVCDENKLDTSFQTIELGTKALHAVRQTAESYRLATILYVHYRILGYGTYIFHRFELTELKGPLHHTKPQHIYTASLSISWKHYLRTGACSRQPGLSGHFLSVL